MSNNKTIESIRALLDSNKREDIESAIETLHFAKDEYKWLHQYAKARLELLDTPFESWYKLFYETVKYGTDYVQIAIVPKMGKSAIRIHNGKVKYEQLSMIDIQKNVANELHYIATSHDMNYVFQDVRTLEMAGRSITGRECSYFKSFVSDFRNLFMRK